MKKEEHKAFEELFDFNVFWKRKNYFWELKLLPKNLNKNKIVG